MATTMAVAMVAAMSAEQKAAILASTIRRPQMSESDALDRLNALTGREHAMGLDPAHRPAQFIRSAERLFVPDGYRQAWDRYMVREGGVR